LRHRSSRTLLHAVSNLGPPCIASPPPYDRVYWIFIYTTEPYYLKTKPALFLLEFFSLLNTSLARHRKSFSFSIQILGVISTQIPHKEGIVKCLVMRRFVQYCVLASEGGNQELTLGSTQTHGVSGLSDTDTAHTKVRVCCPRESLSTNGVRHTVGRTAFRVIVAVPQPTVLAATIVTHFASIFFT
jgi:hypothetical protein